MTVFNLKLLFYPLLFIVLATIGSVRLQPAEAAQQTIPEHYISIKFDLKAESFEANSRIVVPAGVGLQLDFSYLNISRLVINGQEVTPIPAENYLNISQAANEQEILLSYSKKTPLNSSPYNIISNSGITLINDWFPVSDREMIFKLTAVIPQNFSGVSEADEIIEFGVDGNKQLTFNFPHPLFSINFIAGPYIVSSENFGKDKTLFAYFFPEDQNLVSGYLAKAKEYLERYENLLGPYPYERFSIVENRLPTGFAMPTFTLLGQAVVRLPFIVDTSLGHEVLHAWFGNGIRLSPGEGNWVEGLTTYLADQSFAADEGRDTEYRKEQLVKYQSYVRPDMDLKLRNFSNVGHEDTGGQPVRAVGYNKSSMFFHMLRNKVGQDKFIEALRDFYKRSKFNAAGWSDLQTSFESTAGTDLSAFFSQWLDRIDVPDLGIKDRDVTNDKGYPILTFKLTQDNDPPYDLEVPIVIKTTMEEINKTLQVSGKSTSVEIPLTAVPETLVIDPGYDLMRKLVSEELPPTWSRFLGSSSKLAVLASEKDQALYEPLLKELEEFEGLIVLQDDVKDKDLAENSLLFLGAEGDLSRSLFAEPNHPADGFTVDVRNNPLNREQVAVLVSAPDTSQVKMSASKLRHYGKYSYLSFKDGRVQEKKITETDQGITLDLVRLPEGIQTSSSQTFNEIINSLLQYRVIYVGEQHNNYGDHMLQLEVIRGLYQQDPKLAIGMEMFPRSSQPVLDRYLAGEMDEKTFLKESHYFETWRFDYRLYRDIINFAAYKHLPVIGLNLEKDIVSQVFKNGGTAELEPEQTSLLPQDRKLDEPGYRERIESAFFMHAGQDQNGNFGGFLQAQALWDETMAQTIADYLKANPDRHMVIIAGGGHVNKRNAIPPRVARRLDVSQAVVLNNNGIPYDTNSVDYVFFSPPAVLEPLPLLGVMLNDTKDEEGLLVTGLDPKGQAKKVGIKEKDVILAINSEPVNNLEDVRIQMLYQEDSDSVTVRVKRKKLFGGTKELDIKVPLKGNIPVHHG